MSLSSNHQSFIRGLTGKIKKAMNDIGKEEVRNIQRTIDTPGPEPSQPGRPPHMQTEELHDSIGSQVHQANATKVNLTFFADAEHAEYMEFGTKTIAPRPFLRPHRDRFRQRFLEKLKRKLDEQH